MAKFDEDDIQDWVSSMGAYTPDKRPKGLKEKILSKIKDVKWEISYFYGSNIRSPIKSFFIGVNNIWKWRKIIYNDRWWDYSFLMAILEFKIKDLEYNWGKNTHYVNDYKEKDTLKQLLEDIEWMNNPDNEMLSDYETEYLKRSRRFFGRLDRNHRKFWD